MLLQIKTTLGAASRQHPTVNNNYDTSDGGRGTDLTERAGQAGGRYHYGLSTSASAVGEARGRKIDLFMAVDCHDVVAVAVQWR